jgi:diguanylate cyclase (GGDEF)-like protein
MELKDKVKESLAIFKNLYDTIRIVDPINKKTSIVKANKIEEVSTICYAFWTKGTYCNNCIAMRAYIEKDTFVKIEYDRDKIILIIATPIEVDGSVYVAEIIKDITENGSMIHKITENSSIVEDLISSMNEKAIKDELTGVFNRRYINERLPVDINYSKIRKLPLSIIMTDIDFFKKVNDRYGHVIGDKVLVDFSSLIFKSIRSNTDWVARYGGEEFIIVLNDTELKSAYIVAEKIRKQLEDATFKYDGNSNINITSSFGVYSVTDYNIELSELLSKVDKNLYEAKVSGRNRSVISQGEMKEIDLVSTNDKEQKLAKLNNRIEELREILNEICSDLDKVEHYPARLAISESLDELIVEYMKEINKKD